MITLPYCFLNTEVRTVLKTNWERWQTNRHLGDNSSRETRSTRNSLSQGDFHSTTRHHPHHHLHVNHFKINNKNNGDNGNGNGSPDPERIPLNDRKATQETVTTLTGSPAAAGNKNGNSVVTTTTTTSTTPTHSTAARNGASPNSALGKRHFVRATIHLDEDGDSQENAALMSADVRL